MRSGERYAERMSLPVAGWLAVIAAAVLAGALSNFGDMRWWRVTASVALMVAVVAGAWWLGRLRVSVAESGGEVWLHVDDAKLPMSAVAEVQVLEPVAYSDALGVAQHPLAFAVQRPWINRGLRIVLDDPDDPTPYWIVASRRPERLKAALTAARESVEA
ncbi:DUF3093 domain-containing protein [Glycomyces tritici]|uniref:DUF3093 domain-containing protein n=1 Tax=Glycomyces tritici TaxID=2665176 RepID=A0ABT7YME8_9ACTN|nr:DUF3093 domain-containing protein [Glycomyces tritici]MDN3239804.1 DUF3093 domain-containing protein [Glycomyces tritici]